MLVPPHKDTEQLSPVGDREVDHVTRLRNLHH